jgi:DNA repair exonuclease SbcCD ATPase subunit
MIQAVQVESTAYDTMKERIKELDIMRNQLANLTKKCLENDQVNLNLKNSIVKIQDAYVDARRKNSDYETIINNKNNEVIKLKNELSKEINIRQSKEKENIQLTERITSLEGTLINLEADNKRIPALEESNEIFKMDIQQLKERQKSDKNIINSMKNQISMYENGVYNMDTYKTHIRQLALQILNLDEGNTLSAIGTGAITNNSSPLAQSSPYLRHNNILENNKARRNMNCDFKSPSKLISASPSTYRMEQYTMNNMNNSFEE